MNDVLVAGAQETIHIIFLLYHTWIWTFLVLGSCASFQGQCRMLQQ
jgi:hypothetical protein